MAAVNREIAEGSDVTTTIVKMTYLFPPVLTAWVGRLLAPIGNGGMSTASTAEGPRA